MTERAIHVGLLISALAVAVWAFKGHGRSAASNAVVATNRRISPLSVIPPGAAFVLSADLARLEQAPLGAFLAGRLSLAGGTPDLAKTCHFDPLTRLSQLALAVPSAGRAAAEQGDFGIVATGPFSAAEITRCASAMIAQRGGEAAHSALGSFSSVRDRKGSGGEIAAKDGLLIVSGGSYFRELLDSAEGTANHEAAGDARHVELRRELGSGEIVATWLLSEGWLERVSGDHNARLSALSGLQALGARVVVTSNVRVSVLLQCADAQGVSEISDLLGEMRSTLGSLGLTPALSAAARRIELTPDGSKLRLTLTLERAELTALCDALFGP